MMKAYKLEEACMIFFTSPEGPAKNNFKGPRPQGDQAGLSEIGNVHFVNSPGGQPTQHQDKTSAHGNDCLVHLFAAATASAKNASFSSATVTIV